MQRKKKKERKKSGRGKAVFPALFCSAVLSFCFIMLQTVVVCPALTFLKQSDAAGKGIKAVALLY